MAFFGGIFHDFLEGPWEEVRGYLREELEQLQAALQFQWNKSFNEDGTLTPDTIKGDKTVATVYVSNEGAGNSPKWAKVNLNNGVKNRLRLANFTEATSQTVLGRETGAGDYASIAVGDALEIDTGALNVLVDGITISINGSNELQSAAGLGNWVPLASGAEPMEFVSDGAGQAVMVWYNP